MSILEIFILGIFINIILFYILFIIQSILHFINTNNTHYMFRSLKSDLIARENRELRQRIKSIKKYNEIFKIFMPFVYIIEFLNTMTFIFTLGPNATFIKVLEENKFLKELLKKEQKI